MTTTVDSFLESVKIRIVLPANQALYTDTRILDKATDSLRENITPLLMSVNQNYLTVESIVATVANQSDYRIPYRAIGRGLRDLKMMRDSNRANIRDITLVALEDAHLFGNTGQPTCFYFRGDRLVLVPTPLDTASQMVMYYNMQLSRLIKTDQAAKITGISGATITCSSVPTTIMAGVVVDFIQGTSG